MVAVEVGKIMGVATAELGVFLEQAFLQVETEGLGFIVNMAGLDLLAGELIDLTVGE